MWAGYIIKVQYSTVRSAAQSKTLSTTQTAGGDDIIGEKKRQRRSARKGLPGHGAIWTDWNWIWNWIWIWIWNWAAQRKAESPPPWPLPDGSATRIWSGYNMEVTEYHTYGA